MADAILSVDIQANEQAFTRTIQNLAAQNAAVLQNSFSKISLPLGRITGDANEFSKSLAASNARVLAFGASAAAIYAVKSSFERLLATTINVENQLAKINSVFNLTQSNIKKFSTELFTLANNFSVPFEEASKAAESFARHGLSVEETLKRTSAALSLMRLTGIGMAEAVSSLTALLNTFTKEALTSEEIVNRLAAVGQSFAVGADGLAEALSRVGSSASDANVSLNEIMGLIASASQLTGRSATVIGNSFKTMFTRLQRPEVLKDLEEVGIKSHEASGQTKPMLEILKNLASVYDTLGASQKSYISEVVGGVYQINILKAVMKDLGSSSSYVQAAMDKAANSSGFVQKRMEILNETIASQLVRTMNDLVQVSSNLGNSAFGQVMKNGLTGLGSSIQTIGSLVNPQTSAKQSPTDKLGEDTIQGFLKGLGTFIQGPVIQGVFTILIKLTNTMRKFLTDSYEELSGINQAEKERLSLNESITQWLKSEKDTLSGILTGQIQLNEAAAQYLSYIKAAASVSKAVSVTAELMTDTASSKIKFNKTPNLYNPVADALRRENMATGGHAVLSRDSRLVSSENPLGLAAIDSRTQRNATEAVNQHLTLGQSLSDIKGMGTVTPNLAAGGFQIGELTSSIMLSTLAFVAKKSPELFQEKMDQSTEHGFLSKFAQEGDVLAARVRNLNREFEKLTSSLIKGEKTVTPSFQNQKYGINQLSELETVFKSEIGKYKGFAESYEAERKIKREKLSDIGFKGTLISSFGGGLASQYAKSLSPDLSSAIDEFSSGLTTASQVLWSFPNKFGVIGAFSVAASAGISAFNIFHKGIAGAEKSLEIISEKNQRISTSLDALSAAMNNYEALINDGAANYESILRAQRNYSETLARLSSNPETSKIASQLINAPDNASRNLAILNAKSEMGRQTDFRESAIALSKYASERSFFGSRALGGVNPLGYGNDQEKTRVQQLIEAASAGAVANMVNKEKMNQYIGGDVNSFTDAFKKYESKANQAFAELENMAGGKNMQEIYHKIQSQLIEEQINSSPNAIANRRAAQGENFIDQTNTQNAANYYRNTEKRYVNQGALRTFGILGLREALTQQKFGRESLAGAQGQANLELYGLRYGEQTNEKYRTSLELQRIESNRSSQVSGLQTNASAKIADLLKQTFEENVVNLSKSGGVQNEYAQPEIAKYINERIQGINNGINSVLSQGNFSQFFQNGKFNEGSMIEAITKYSGGSRVQNEVRGYLQSNSGYDIMKVMADTTKQILDVNQNSFVEAQKQNINLQGILKQIDFKMLANYLGGIKSVTDRNSRRNLEKNITRGSYLMYHGRTDEARASGAAQLLSSFKEMGIPINTTGNSPLSALMKDAMSIGVENTARLQGQMGERIYSSISRLTGSGSRASRGVGQLTRMGGATTAQAAFDMAFKPENANISNNAENNISNNLAQFGANVNTSMDALTKFAESSYAVSTQELEMARLLSLKIQELAGKSIENRNAQSITGLTPEQMGRRRYQKNLEDTISEGKEDSTYQKFYKGIGEYIPTITQFGGAILGNAAYSYAKNKKTRIGTQEYFKGHTYDKEFENIPLSPRTTFEVKQHEYHLGLKPTVPEVEPKISVNYPEVKAPLSNDILMEQFRIRRRSASPIPPKAPTFNPPPNIVTPERELFRIPRNPVTGEGIPNIYEQSGGVTMPEDIKAKLPKTGPKSGFASPDFLKFQGKVGGSIGAGILLNYLTNKFIAPKFGENAGELTNDIGQIGIGSGFFGLKGGAAAGISVAGNELGKYLGKRGYNKLGIASELTGDVGGGALLGGLPGFIAGAGITSITHGYNAYKENKIANLRSDAVDRYGESSVISTIRRANSGNSFDIGRLITNQLSASIKNLQNEKEPHSFFNFLVPKQFTNETQKNINRLTQQREALEQSLNTGSSAQVLEVLRAIQDQLSKSAGIKEGETNKNNNQTVPEIKSDVKIDITVKDADKLPDKVNDAVLKPIIKQLADLQSQINGLINVNNPKPAKI